MSSSGTPGFVLRDLDAACESGMHLTLVEVEGEQGRQAYPLPWTRARLHELLDPARRLPAQAFLAVAGDEPGHIVGHTIVRIDEMPDGRPYGLVSNTDVDPPHRRAGIADRLLARGEAWIRAQGMAEAATWTSATNQRLIRLYQKHGYTVAEEAPHDDTGTPMVRLTKALPRTGSASNAGQCA